MVAIAEHRAVLPIELVAVIVGSTWTLVAVLWVVISRWENTGVTEARRRELERQRAEGSSSIVTPWYLGVLVILAGLPVLFVIDGLIHGLGILYSPTLSFFAGPSIVLQVVGMVLAVVGLAILLGVGRKLAVNVYRLAADERKLMATGVHRFIRHPFYLQFILIPISSLLVSLNYLSLLLLAYTMLWEPKPITAWMREEEDALRRRYGPEAEAYLARTGRILPRVRKSG